MKSKLMLIMVFAIFICTVSATCAADANETTIATQEDNQMELTLTEDEIQTNENDNMLTQTEDAEILTSGEGSYSDLRADIANKNLTKSHYRYNDGDNDTIEINTPGVINGNGAVIDMAGSNIRAFHVTVSDVTIKNLTIKNANYNGNGGAIYFSSSDTSCTVSNCNFTGNTATGDGGAVYFNGKGEVTNCNFVDNKATGEYGEGGAIRMASGSVSNCNFTNNTATIDSGAVYFLNTGTVSNCNFVNNSATGEGSLGGAVRMYSGTVSNCNFTNNTATSNGGAIRFSGTGTVANCNFTGNTAGNGGAVRMYSGTVSNCNFTNNSATENGGAVYFVNSGTVSNCNFTNNKATGDYACGGAVYFVNSGTVSNCNFTNNKATGDYACGGAVYFYQGTGSMTNCNFTNNTATGEYTYGGAIRFNGEGTVTNCNFTDNIASIGGAVYFNGNGDVSNCNFTDNSANVDGGAIYFYCEGNVTNCNFTNNTATYYGGAIYFDETSTVANCNFTGNNATTGSAIYFLKFNYADTLTVSDSTFLNNRANAGALDIVKTENNITITFTGQNNLLNAIYSREDAEVAFYNVTYWGAKGITTISATISGSNKAAGQKITVGVVVNGKIVLNQVNVTNKEGTIVLNINVGDNYYITARHDTDSYYTEAERTISNNINVNVTSQTTINKTVNITAKSNIPQDVVQGKLLFILPNGTQINATYAGNGTWWAVHRFADYGFYQVNALYEGLNNVTVNKGILAVIPEHTFYFLNYTINGNDNPVIELSHDFYFDPAYDATFVNGIVINRPVTIKGNGNAIDAKRQARIFYVQSANAVLENLTIINANSVGDGGAIYFSSSATSGTVTNCNFTNNTAEYGGGVYFSRTGEVTNCNFVNNSASTHGGAVYFYGEGNVTNCNFVDNKATGDYSYGGAVYFSSTGTVSNCTFADNTAYRGGAVYFVKTGTVSNCTFADNTASEWGGAIGFSCTGTVTNCNFTGNNATTGSAIYFYKLYSSDTLTVSDSTFLNNRANAEALEITKNDNNITITFTGRNNLLNAIYSRNDAEVTFTNVTYWGAKGITTVSATMSGSNKATGQNITVGVVVNNELVLSDVMVTKENGTIVLNISAGENYYISARHNTDSYYTEAETTISNNTKFNANVTSKTTTNKTVNITAKSNIPNDVVQGKLLFILPNGTQIEATYGDNGTWWAEHTFDAYGEYKVNATYVGLDNVTINNGTITINKVNSTISLDNIVLDYGETKNVTVTTTGATGITAKIGEIEANVTGFVISIPVLDAGTYTLTVTTMPDDDYNPVTKEVNITVNRVNSTLTVSDIIFDYSSSGSTVVSLTGADGVNATVVGQPKAVVKVNGTNITVSGLDAGTYTLTVTAIADKNHNNITKNATITVNKLKTELTGNAITTTYNVNKDLVITLKDSTGKALSGVKVTVDLNGAKTYTTDKNGQVKVSTKGIAPKAYTAKVTFSGDTNYDKSTKDIKVTVKKATPKLTAKKKTYKTTPKTKKYTIVLKDNTGKAIKKAKVTLKVKGKTYKATTNSKGKATFKITKLNKKGTFKATITYKGNKYYNKISKKAKIKVIVTFKTVSKGSKDKATVKEIQRALKDKGYYLTYQGHYLKVDGKFKGCTERSLKEFQKDNGLKVTGKVDEKTARKLGIL